MSTKEKSVFAGQVSALVATLQTERGMSLRQLSARSGVGRTTIAEFLSGGRVPGIDTVDKLIRALGYEPILQLRSLGDGPFKAVTTDGHQYALVVSPD